MSDESRRSWMVTIGQAAVGWGFASRLDGAAPEDLPPGLYKPSTDHLGHALMSAEEFHPMVRDCPTDYIRPRSGPFEPLFFSDSDFAVVRRLAALLLGETSAAESYHEGGTVQGVAEWIDLHVASAKDVHAAAHRISPLYRSVAVAYMGDDAAKQSETADPVRTSREGLEYLARQSRERHSKNFLDLRTEEQLTLLDEISDERHEKQVQNAGTRFFDLMKRETIRGFYTSRAGLKELDYKGNAYYARSPGCDSK